MENFKLLSVTLLLLAVSLPEISTEVTITPKKEGSVKPPLVVNPIDHLTDQDDGSKPQHTLVRAKRQNDGKPENKNVNTEKPKPPPNFNPLEDLILNQDKNGFKAGDSLSRVKRQYSRYPYPYPVPIPILIGGGFGGFGGYGGRGFGGRGFGGRGFGGRGFGGRGFGGRGFGGRGFGGRGFGGGFGGRGVGGGFGGGRGGGGGRG